MSQSTWYISKAPSRKGKIAIVTGANAGLGSETTLALAQKEQKLSRLAEILLKQKKLKQLF